MSTCIEAPYVLIPLSIQREGDIYIIGNGDIGDFYQFPESGKQILEMLQAGHPIEAIKNSFEQNYAEKIDVDDFVAQLNDIGFLHYCDRNNLPRLQSVDRSSGWRCPVDPRIARALLSRPMILLYISVIVYAAFEMMLNPALRPDRSAFYTDSNRTALFLVILTCSVINSVVHEIGHILAAAKAGITSKIAISNRLWYIVAETDLTGVLALRRSQRYFPIMAGILTDILNISILTLLLQFFLAQNTQPLALVIIRISVLQTLISIAFQFNVYIKTDIYYLLCTYFSYADLDRDAKAYISRWIYRLSFRKFDQDVPTVIGGSYWVLVVFTAIWIFGRILALLILIGVLMPTIIRYFFSIFDMIGSQTVTSYWRALDNIAFGAMLLMINAVGFYMWTRRRTS